VSTAVSISVEETSKTAEARRTARDMALGLGMDEGGAEEIARRCRGTPRVANRLLRRVRDYAQVRGTGAIDRPTANAALTMLEVDAHGFDEIDRRLLLTIIQKYDGGPVGLGTLAATLMG